MAIVLNDMGNYWTNSVGGGFNRGMDRGMTAALEDDLRQREYLRQLGLIDRQYMHQQEAGNLMSPTLDLGSMLGGGYFGAEAPQFNLTLPGNYGNAPESTQNMGLLQGIAGRRLF